MNSSRPDAESKSNLSGSAKTEASPPSWSGRKVSRQERRRNERMKRKFKGSCVFNNTCDSRAIPTKFHVSQIDLILKKGQ